MNGVAQQQLGGLGRIVCLHTAYTHLNCMTRLCWLNLVMTDTSMNGFGSAERPKELK